MISLDQQIKKDKDRQHRKHRDKRDYHRYQRYQQHDYRKNHHQNKYHDDKYHYKNTKEVIRISNLHYAITKEQLETHFSKFGKIKSCRIQWDKMGRSKETATIQFFNKQEQQKAVAQMNGVQIQGQNIKVEMESHKFNGTNKKHEINKQNNNKYKNNKYYRRN